MLSKRKRLIHSCLLILLGASQLLAKADRFRVVWQTDPSTSAVIGWDQVSGKNPILHLDINDYGNDASSYALKKSPDRVERAKGMNNHFVRLTGLLPNTTYYFLVTDSEGTSRQLFFTTAPDSPEERLSIIAGGDSRNYREARQEANVLAGKLRPHCIMFGGDFTAGDSDREWVEWMDDWQLTIAKDGRMTPIIPARGNHEESNKTLNLVFDIQSKNVNFAINLGGDLLRIYTLNTMIPIGGEQQDWLTKDLRRNFPVQWKFAQYHQPMRPHTSKKAEKHDQVVFWAPLFLEYNMNLAVECDAHVVKATYPIRPAKGSGSDEGFIRDDNEGTVYVGEGCWGAPLRANDDDKSWTRASGSFNQFHWIFVDEDKIEVRFVKTDGSDRVADIDPQNIFKTPIGLNIWSPPAGDVITIRKPDRSIPGRGEEILAARSGVDLSRGPALRPAPVADETAHWEQCPMLMADAASGNVKVKYELRNKSNVTIRIINKKKQEVSKIELSNQASGEYLKTLRTSHLPAGNYLAIVKENGRVVKRYRVRKRK
ncbi:MAG TPA: metallophosphoesterase family protein [Bacteroidetes bacterium]|nr:metallophosphoesterase family protein [Bacteroidota bacterium]